MADSIITKQELIDAQKDAQTLEEVISGEPGKLVETRLGRKVYTLASVPQINTMTREEIDTAVASRAPQATTYTKTEVDSALLLKAPQSNTYTKGEVDASLTAITGGRKAYPTLAAALADKSTFPMNSIIEITLDGANSGAYYWNGADLTRSQYDPLTQAKADATTKANAAEANAKTYADTNKLDLSKIITGYLGGNKIGPKTPRYTNLGVTRLGGNISTSSDFDSVVLQIKEGDELYIENSANTFISDNGARLSFFAEDPNLNRTQTAITHTTTNITNPVNHWKITAPVGAKYLMLNTRSVVVGTTYNLDWSVHGNAYNPSFVAGDETVTSIRGVNVGDYAALAADKAELNAKTYADTRLKLDRPIVASNKVSKIIQNLESSNLFLSTRIPTISPKVGSYVYAINVKPNTTYTLAIAATPVSLIVREFAAEPISEVSRLEALRGQEIIMTTYQTVPVLRRRGTFTTGENTNYITLDPRLYSNYDFVMVEGEYAEDIEASLIATVDQANKQASFDYLYAKNLQSDKFGKSKNLFKGYTFGSRLTTLRVVSDEYVSGLWSPGAGPTQAGYWESVAAVVPVKPNTTYTISKEESNRFAVLLCKDLTNSKLVLRDSSLRSYTVTTGAEDNFIAIVLSDIGEQPLVQIEEGANVTAYESVGDKFAKAALPIGKKLTDIVKQTDNAYISLGMQSDEFRYYPTSPTQWTTDTVLNKYYEPLRAEFPANITRNILGKDASGLYDVYEYIFKPDNYEQTIFITAGMHPTEMVTPFALGALLNEIYRNPSKHEGLAYLRNKVKIVVIPVVNVWGANQNPKVVPTHYTNSNAVNLSRNFPERWEQIVEEGPYNVKGSSPASEAETQHIMTVMHREKDELAFYLDLHTGQGWTQDTLLYWLEEDNFLRPVLQNIVSMRNDIVRKTLGREPINETYETQRATGTFYPWRVLGVPSATIEYGTGSTSTLDNTQTTYYVDLVFNSIHYALKANLKSKRKQAELNEHNKQFISLYNTLSAYNNVVNQVWNYARITIRNNAAFLQIG